MANIIAGFVGLIATVMFVLFVTGIIIIKKNKNKGMKFLKFAGLSFVVVVLLTPVYSFLSPEEHVSTDKEIEEKELTVSTDINKSDTVEKTNVENEATINVGSVENTETSQDKNTTNVTEQNVDTSSIRKSEIKTATTKIITSDLQNTNIEYIEVNNYQMEENKYIVLPHLIWNQTNSKSTTVEMLEMYSDHLAASLNEQYPEIEELTIFWEVPYHLENDNIAKFNYMRTANGMAKNDKWLAPVLQ